MPKVMMFVKMPKGDHWEGFGSREFEVIPRIGEYIGDDEYIYRVVSIHHPISQTMTAGDLYAVQVGKGMDFIKSLFEKSK
jgi:hypothetical protein